MMSMAMVLPLELGDRRLDELLSMWTRWMSASPLRELLWYPDGACGCVGGGYSQTFEDMVDAADARMIEAVNGAIESLSPMHQCAMMHVHLYAVFRFRSLVDDIYAEARAALKIALPSRGVY